MRIHLLVIAALAIAGPASAQSIKKVGSEVHNALKTTGRQVKEAAGEVGSATHSTLKKAGSDSKAELRRHGVKRVGGDVGKAAIAASNSGKKVGRSAKSGLKSASTTAHHDLSKAGKAVKDSIKQEER